VHELHCHRGGHAPLGRRAGGAGGEQGERGPKRLAAAAAHRVARGIRQTEVIGRDDAHVRSEPGDRGFHRRADQVPGQGHALGHYSCH
jgi:hypothetical protein